MRGKEVKVFQVRGLKFNYLFENNCFSGVVNDTIKKVLTKTGVKACKVQNAEIKITQLEGNTYYFLYLDNLCAESLRKVDHDYLVECGIKSTLVHAE